MVENKKIGRKNFLTIAYGLAAFFCLTCFFYTKPNDFFYVLVSGAKVKNFFKYNIFFKNLIKF